MSQMSKCLLNKSRSRVPNHEENLARPYSLGFGSSSSSWTQNEKVTFISPSSALIVQSECHNRWEPRESHSCWLFFCVQNQVQSLHPLVEKHVSVGRQDLVQAGLSHRVVRHPKPLRTEGEVRRGRATAVRDEMSWMHVAVVNQHGCELEQILWRAARNKDTKRKRIISFYFQVWVKIKALRQFSLFWSVFCPHVWLHPPSPSSWLPDIQSMYHTCSHRRGWAVGSEWERERILRSRCH